MDILRVNNYYFKFEQVNQKSSSPNNPPAPPKSSSSSFGFSSFGFSSFLVSFGASFAGALDSGWALPPPPIIYLFDNYFFDFKLKRKLYNIVFFINIMICKLPNERFPTFDNPDEIT